MPLIKQTSRVTSNLLPTSKRELILDTFLQYISHCNEYQYNIIVGSPLDLETVYLAHFQYIFSTFDFEDDYR